MSPEQPGLSPTAFPDRQDIFAGNSLMSQRMRAFDWGSTPLGEPEGWPQSLKTIVRTMLTSRFAMWMGWGPDLAFFYNDAYRPTLGVKEHQALGRPSAEVWAEIWPDIAPRIEQVLSTGEATWDEGLLLVLERSGYSEETYHTFSYSPVADDEGRIAGLFCVVTEETERVIGERRSRVLRDLASRLTRTRQASEVWDAVRACLEEQAHDIPFALAYEQTGEPNADPALQLLMQIGGEASWSEQVDPELLRQVSEGQGAPADRERLQQVTLPGTSPCGPWARPPSQLLYLPVAPAGLGRRPGVLVVGVNPFRQLDEAYLGFLKLFVGQVKASLASADAYEQERRRAEALAEVDRAKTTFFENASHELRTSLTLMLGPLEDLLAGDLGELTSEQSRVLDMTHRNGLRLLRLVNTLLDFSRPDAGRFQPSFVAVDLPALTTDLASSFRSAMERAGLTFEVTAQPLPQSAYVNPDLWEKVVLNLPPNAFKFTLKGGVRLSLAPEGHFAVMRVQDSGVGIPEAELGQVFQRFHRIQGQEGRSFEGTGIGLAFVREVIEQHGGSIEVQSEVGQGSTFTVRLPLGAAHLPPDAVHAGGVASPQLTGQALPYVAEALRWLPTAEEVAAEGSGTPEGVSGPVGSGASRGRVLVADDNADLRDYIRHLLGTRHEVLLATDGLDALEAARRERPDLIVTDVMMPRLSGFELLRKLRGDPATHLIPVIVLSARAGDEARLHGIEQGADDYLVKPFSGRELLAKVNSHLSLAALRREALKREQAYASELESQVREHSREVVQWRDRYELAVQSSGHLLFDWDPETGRLVYGQGLEKICGYSEEDLGPHVEGWLNLVHPDDRQRLEDALGKVVAGGGTYHLSYRLIHRSGRTVHIEADGQMVPATDGQGEHLLGFARDVTERHEAELALHAANAELRRSNAELERFAYIASHDLQEPIRSVGSFAGLLSRRYGEHLDERGKKYLGHIEQGAGRMQTLVQDLLQFSRLNAERPPLRPTDAAHVVSEALARLNAAVQEKEAHVEVGDLPSVMGDGPRLVQLFQNLIGNAIKFSRSGVAPHIGIHAHRQGEQWHFVVRDNGIGVAEPYRERIFEMFQRLHGREHYVGNGMGLAICRKIATQHGGQLWMDSVPDESSTFHLLLQAVPAHPPLTDTPRRSNHSAASQD
ncbi:ATP-binding protein [Deinococcus wulumuqiensis]|uniref:ATP-binding protein n=1 Tax=Deinococcus wulumuqiensis TaxID=980427 RepID=UPI00242DCE64|nr:ATP-binding protein [Deinococcus wulumuqiensis]